MSCSKEKPTKKPAIKNLFEVKNTSTNLEEYEILTKPDRIKLKPSDEKITLYKNIESKNREFNILELTTTSKNIKLPFTIKKGSEDSDDDDGIIMVDLSDEDGVSIKSNKEFTAKYNTEFTLELEFSLEETKEFYVDFHTKDDTEEE